MKIVKTDSVQIPKFKNESEEADWWASKEGREYVKRESAKAQGRGVKFKGSAVLRKLARKRRSA
jgi:hypothetical protein